MISTENLKCLNNIITAINNGTLTDEELEKSVEDPQLALEIINSVNKQKLKSVDSKYKKEKTVALKKETVYSYNKEDVQNIFSDNDNSEIIQKYNTSELKAMYFALYGINPRSSMKKMEIIDEIRGYFSYIKRNVALASL